MQNVKNKEEWAMRKIFTNSPTEEVSVWEKHGGEIILAKKYGLKLISQNFFDPGRQVEDEYVCCEKEAGVTVVPILRDGDLVIIRQFKQGTEQVIFEFPAGMSMGNPALPEVELKEESGLRAGRTIYLGHAYVAPRKFRTVERIFVALDCELLPEGPKPGPDEIIETWVISPKELWELIKFAYGSVSGFSEIAAQRAADAGYIKRL